MRLKLVSYFLLFLFSIVIAFPGYGSGSSTSKSRTSLAAKIEKKATFSWKLVLKKCLAKGINMIEEERNVEEDEDTCCKEVCYIMSVHPLLNPIEEVLFDTCRLEEYGLMNMRSVPYPPPNFC